MGQQSKTCASPFYCNIKFGIFLWSRQKDSNLLECAQRLFFFPIYLHSCFLYRYNKSNDKITSKYVYVHTVYDMTA